MEKTSSKFSRKKIIVAISALLLVLAAAFVFLLRQHTPQGINNHRCFKKIDNV